MTQAVINATAVLASCRLSDFAQLRQHGRIGEVKKKAADEEEQEYTILCEQPQRVAEPLVVLDALTSATSAVVVDLPRLNQQRGRDGGDHETYGRDKDSSIAEVVAYREDQQSGGDITRGVEGLIAAELAVETALADQAHGDRRQRRRQKRASGTDQHLRAVYSDLAGLPREQRRAEAQHQRAGNHNQTLVARLIDNAAGRGLQHDRHQAARRERIESH